MHYNYKFRKLKLLEIHKDFCKEYATNGYNSLEAYNKSHKHINKVRASTLLQNPVIWYDIIKEIRIKTDKNVADKNIIEKFDLCKKETTLDPIRIFQIYTVIDEKSNKVKYHDLDILTVIRKLAYCFNFWEYVDRQYFVERIISAIKSEYSYFCIVKAANATAWTKEFNKLNNELFLNKINLNNILTYGISKDGK